MNIDLKKAKDLIIKETGAKSKDAEFMAERLQTLHPYLDSVINSWLEGEKIDFTYNGISLSDIMKKERCSYLSSLFTMTLLIESPKFAQIYPKVEFYNE